jgi:sigma-B regulation protein RsbU (phosphoserine phosphatase)
MTGLHRVLIVEDEEVSLLQLQRFLTKELGVETLVAHDGEEAWELYNTHEVQFVISDWEMPRCDGPELCRRIRQDQTRYTYFIMLTAREGEEDLLAGMASGADDYMRKPPSFEELKSRIKAGFRVIDLEQRLAAQNTQVEATLRELRRAVAAAGLVQQRLLPSAEELERLRTRLGLHVAYKYQSCESLGGDVLSVVEQDNGRLAIFLGDVSGHGIAASLAAVSLSACVRIYLRASADPIQLATQANGFCCREFPEEVYATMAYLLITPETRSFTGLVAGNPPLIKISADGSVQEYSSSVPPLGLFPERPQSGDMLEVTLGPGDRLVAYTDGIVETRNLAGELFSVEQLIQSLSRARNAPVEHLPGLVLADAERWRGTHAAAEDDMTVVALELDSTGGSPASQLP